MVALASTVVEKATVGTTGTVLEVGQSKASYPKNGAVKVHCQCEIFIKKDMDSQSRAD